MATLFSTAPHLRGLSSAEVAARAAEGPNEIPSAASHGLAATLKEILREPMFLLLTACGAIYFVLGDGQEALMLLGFVFFITGLTLVQERKTGRALKALRDLSSPRALVLRDGEPRRVAGRDVVRGDLLILGEGDRVAADGELVSSSHLAVDESLLTGESLPVRKIARAADPPAPDGAPAAVFAGTLVVQGQGLVRVRATGAGTELGKIGRTLGALAPEPSRLQQEMARLVRGVAAAGVSLSALVVLAQGLIHGHWLDGFLAGLTLAMALLPNEFPVVLVIFLSMGAWRLSRHQVLARRMPVVETLGSATVLCVDKTGTLTENRMEVHSLDTGDAVHAVPPPGGPPLPEAFHACLEFGILASAPHPVDPMEKALHALGARDLANTEHLHGDWTLAREYPLSPELLAMSQVWTSPDRRHFVIAAKGAPEAVADLCHWPADQRADLSRRVERLAAQGLRVLAVAKSAFEKPDLPGGQHDFDFTFLGLIALADPVRAAVPAALQECRRAGLRVVMITGDFPGTARSVARAIGLANPDEVITGPELETLAEDALGPRVRRVNVFARMAPAQKLRLVRALQAQGEIVAMTGDGVNDAPALKAAHIGVAMGERGTDVARESAGLVLLKDDFSSIVRAVRLGRRVFDNLKKGMAYILAAHVPIAGMSLLPVFINGPLVLLPVHIAFLHLIIDPACSIVFEAEGEEAGLMDRPPRPPTEPLFGRATLGPSLLQGLVVWGVVGTVYGFSLTRGDPADVTRALTFTTLLAANLGLIVTNRSWTRGGFARGETPAWALWGVLGGSLLLLTLGIYIPFLGRLFHLAPLPAGGFALCLAVGAAGALWFEILKKTKTLP